ncbi:MAG: hypothetical protein EAZ61_12855 [Oscillatoriales cyanobacterium]|nr:MAG: hypothetical protein EAZ61_12855 [Oscillatoriales cyanobacterium]
MWLAIAEGCASCVFNVRSSAIAAPAASFSCHWIQSQALNQLGLVPRLQRSSVRHAHPVP